jgi:transposase
VEANAHRSSAHGFRLTGDHRQKGTGYFRPVSGDQDEVAFPFAASRAGSVVREALGSFCGVLLIDGYRVYERFAQTVNRPVHAQGWSHTRRQFVEAERAEPTLVRQVLDYVGALSDQEARLASGGW